MPMFKSISRHIVMLHVLMSRVAVDMKVRIHIHIRRFYVDIHGYIVLY